MGSSSSNATATTNTDRRIVNESGIVSTSDLNVKGNQNVITVESLDAGIVNKALDTVQINDALGAKGFDSLLNAADKLFTQGQNLIGQTQTAVADAYRTAKDTEKSTIDNRTIVVLGVAAAAVGVYAMRKK